MNGKKIIKRLTARDRQFKKHPVAKDNRIKALSRYILFNVKNRFRKSITYKWIGPLKFIAAKGEAGIVGNIYCGLFEFNESMFILHYLREKDCFVDVGANVGHYSLLASGINKSRSIAIEPVPEAFQKLNDHIKLNNLEDKIEALNIGLAQEPGALYFSTDKSTMNRIVKDSYKNAIQIPVKTLDSVLAGETPNILKIDVEGYELFVLNGSAQALKNPSLKAVIIEINNSTRFYGVKVQEILDIFKNNGFLPYSYDPINRELNALETYNTKQFNTIFIRDLKFVKERIATGENVKIWNKSF